MIIWYLLEQRLNLSSILRLDLDLIFFTWNLSSNKSVKIDVRWSEPVWPDG